MKRGNKLLIDDKSSATSVKVDVLYALTKNPEKFVDELERLCKKHSFKGHHWFFKFSIEG